MDEEKSRKDKSIVQIVPEANERKLKKVPFVELADGRLQGVVSSGSDISRVYVSYIKSGSHDYYCSTNNNRRCGGLGGRVCKHITNLVSEAVLQYGAKQVIQFLNLPIEATDDTDAADILASMQGSEQKESASTVFSRFLNHLQYLEQDDILQPVPEMEWFITKGRDK